MTNPVIDEYGTKRWYNEKGQLHRDNDKPAVVSAHGTKFWYQDGLKHRDGDKPAVIWARDSIWARGSKEWWQNGKCIKRVNG